MLDSYQHKKKKKKKKKGGAIKIYNFIIKAPDQSSDQIDF